MAEIHHYRIKEHLKSVYSDKIDLGRVPFSNPSQIETAMLSRAQAGLSIIYLSNASVDESIEAITDDFKDNGIDAIYSDPLKKTLYLCQSKWISSGQGAPKKRDIQSFLKGVDDLIKLRFEKFNDAVLSKKEIITNSLKDINFKIRLVLTYTSNTPISSEARDEVENYLKDINDDFDDTFGYEVVSQQQLYKALLKGIENSPINLEQITIYDWGKHEEPFEAIYGEVQAEQLAKIWKEHGQSILSKNLRNYKGDSTVNFQIKHTLSNSPNHFWYFNNGMTILCSGIGKSAIHGNDRKAGVFSFNNVSVVNGAQTLGSLGEAFRYFPSEIKNARVQVRFINLEQAPEEFAKEITRYNNTQNRIENKDFAALDPNQERIKHEFLLDKKEYVYRTGEPKPINSNGCDIEEATFALACAHKNINLSVIAHRNIGSIWADIEKPPYIQIFNNRTTGLEVWKAVTVSRIVKSKLVESNLMTSENKQMTSIYGDSLILHKVIEYFGRNRITNHNPEDDIKTYEIEELCDSILESLCASIDQLYPKIHPINLFKNRDKIETLSQRIDQLQGRSRDLFNQD